MAKKKEKSEEPWGGHGRRWMNNNNVFLKKEFIKKSELFYTEKF